MKLVLKDVQLPILEATISGNILQPEWQKKYGKDEYPGLNWYVEVQTDEQFLFDEQWVSARISCENIILPLHRWFDLEGKTVNTSAENHDYRNPCGLSYFWTHETLPFSTLIFGKRTGNKFAIHWEGICDPQINENYYTNVPFLIEAEATFKKISLGADQDDTDTTTLERLAQYLDTSDLIQQPMTEIVRDIPIENRFGFIEPIFRRLFNLPETERYVTRYSVFEPRR